MIKTFKHGDETQISPHFKASEFQCKCGAGHDFKLDTELIEKLEQLFDKLGCSSIVISSGFRCKDHDISVGGSGNGQHTLGKAADFCCFDADKKPIVTYKVCCAAQDIGFPGIARINDTYTHCDVRSSGKWYGDETKGNGSVTDDFYKYYDLPKEGVARMEGVKGIDVSVHNGKIDWQKVKAAGIQFALMRAGFGKLVSQKDERFEENYAGAKAAGIPVGVYWYSYATNVSEALEEAKACIEVIKGKQFEYPVFFDQEEKAALDTGMKNCSAMVRAFCGQLEIAGYWAGLYTSRAFLQSHIEDDIKTRYTLWIAEWGSKLNYNGAVGIWQNSEKGSVSGITGDVDTDISYSDFPARIKAKGLNGYGKQPDKPPEKPETGITVEMTIDGKRYSGTLKPI